MTRTWYASTAGVLLSAATLYLLNPAAGSALSTAGRAMALTQTKAENDPAPAESPLLPLKPAPLQVTAPAAWDLITEDEVRHNETAPHTGLSFAIPPAGAPTIDIEEPNPAKIIRPPITLKIRFHSHNGAVMDLSSISIRYGWLQWPITDRVLQHARLTQEGLFAEGATIPPGSYTITFSIADNKGRTASSSFQFTVGQPRRL